MEITPKTIKSKTVLACKNSINKYSPYVTISFIWVSGHGGLRGNKRANSLTVRVRDNQSINLENSKAYGSTRSDLKMLAGNAYKALWNIATVGEISKILWET